MWPDPVSNPGSLTNESCVLPIALRGLAKDGRVWLYIAVLMMEREWQTVIPDLALRL